MKHFETLDQLLQRMSDVLFPERAGEPGPVSVHSRRSDGDMPLHIASLEGDRHATRLLLEAGADVSAKGDMSCSPLYFAVMGQHVEVAELLLQHGSDPDAQSELGYTPRTLAAQKGDKAMMALFRRHKEPSRRQ
jgi:ankyrin repeat protein